LLSSIKEYQPGPQIPPSIWMTLGLPSRGTRLHDLVYEGLPFEYLERIASLLQVKRGLISNAICMSPTTLARKAKAGRFNFIESDRLVALVNLFEEALSLFENDKAAAMQCNGCARIEASNRHAGDESGDESRLREMSISNTCSVPDFPPHD
jgi:putative toxin-antitoxin system antitoxin component (TIGR02293 family)